MWQNKYRKAVTFSYDDGVLQDQRLVEILNRYGLKATFNVNTSFSRKDEPFYDQDTEVSHFDMDELIPLYQGHEVAVHGYSHLDLTSIPKAEMMKELDLNIKQITELFHHEPLGMAYAFGTYNDEVVQVVSSLGLRYARGVQCNHSFSIQSDLLRFQPTCHHDDPEIFKLIDEFLSSESNQDQVLYIWGHSYEFDTMNHWQHFEEICKKISNQPDVFYGTNEEVLLYTVNDYES